MPTSTLLVVTSYSLPNQALRAILETLATKHLRGIGLTTGKEFLKTTRYQSNQYRQLSTFLRLRKQTKIHRIMLHRSTAAGEFGWIKKHEQRLPERVKHLGKGSGQDVFVSPLSATLGHFTVERMAKEKVWKVREFRRLSGHEMKQRWMPLVVEIKMEM